MSPENVKRMPILSISVTQAQSYMHIHRNLILKHFILYKLERMREKGEILYILYILYFI